ncbi:TetR/AcrR family transcriptional regulator [Pseudomonas sp. PD9R]|uniref:TetR/AcrR family transcriptional regulator n=1 Tax=Pseudomonas sp. PD9R TaxID=2853534 RepID=UPI001C461654|nr:TetR/AcrR family transcriptional regulator [Pseudomonas sp. PD9R]MBV6826410.1 TetR/AcrR family transcriptional regulator [Pseudomonas sp. PD9R]
MLNIASANRVHSARERLLDAAAELFATRGFQAVGLRDLASCLGLQAGSLYHHIENKQSLLFELIESALSNLMLDTMRRLKSARSAREHLPIFIKTFVAFNFNERHKLALITREFANLDEEQKQQIVQLKNSYSSLLSKIIAHERGEKTNSGGDTCPTTHAVIVILFGQSQWYALESTESRLTKTLTNLVMCLIAQSKKNREPAALQRTFEHSSGR